MSMSDLSDALGSSTDEAMEVDTSFLDDYRSRSASKTSGFQSSAEALQAETEIGPEAELRLGQSQDVDHPASETDGPETDGPEAGDEVGRERDDDLEPERSESDEPRAQRGGAGSDQSPVAVSAAATPVDAADAVTLEEPIEPEHRLQAPPKGRHDEALQAESERDVSLEHTDHQDAVQAASGRGGGASTGQPLPTTGFKVGGGSGQPTIRALPEKMVSTLREQLRSTAVRELGVTDREAREFSQRLSQAGLVMAFLLAHLDLSVDVDASTARAAELFRCNDPLLGRVAERLDQLAVDEHARGQELAQMRTELAQVRSTTNVLELMQSYSVADRAENLGRGTAGVGDLELGHRSALRLREMAREAAHKQQRIERDRDGRPIR